jgi:hypothetical protein
MTNYFPVALIGATWSWLMNLPEGILTSLARAVPLVHSQL